MNGQLVVLDPDQTAERGTLEYAASAAACRYGVQLNLSIEEARTLETAIDLADCLGLPIDLVNIVGEFQRALEAALDRAPSTLTGEGS